MKDRSQYVKRTQKDYSLSFKHQVVHEVESGQETQVSVCRKYGIQSSSTIRDWFQKYGIFDKEYQIPTKMPKSADAKIKELEAKINLLEKQKHRLEKTLERQNDKAIIFDMMIEIAKKEYNIDIRKNHSPELLKPSQSKNKKI